MSGLKSPLVWRRHLARACVLAALTFAPGTLPATAGEVESGDHETSPGEALIGTFDLGPQPSTPAPRPDAASGQARLFDRAERLLLAGDGPAAQRVLEQVIAEGPDTPFAARARRRLADLYRTGPATASGISEGTGRGVEAPPPISLDGLAPIPLREPRSGQLVAATGPSRATEPGMRAGLLAGQVEPAPLEVEMAFIRAAGDRVFFANGSAELGSRGRAAIAAQARWLKENPGFEARIEGHADDPPLRAEAQDDLSEARAATVRDALVREGVDPERLGIVPWGREHRVAECGGSDCEAQNQRAVTVLALPAGSSGSALRRTGDGRRGLRP